MTETLRRELDRWGFSDAEIDVYLAILRRGEARASEIGESADVSARHVYRVCERLEERGLVDVDEHVQPTRLRARPPDVVRDVVERSCGTMADEIESLYSRTPDQPSRIEVLKREPTVLARGATLVEDAERWVITVVPPDVVETLADELAAAVDRGVLVLLVTDVDSLSLERSVEEVATVVRTRELPKGFLEFGVGADKIRSLMVSDTAEMGDEHRYSPGLYLDDETIGVRTNDSMFAIEWRLGREYTVPEPAPLPYETDFFRAVVLQAALHQRAGTTLRARVEGRSLPKDRSTTVEGTVVEVRQGMIEPYRDTFVGERTLVLETDEGRVTVGGAEATMEDYAADAVTLSAVDDGPEA